jgi:hypothetical protein
MAGFTDLIEVRTADASELELEPATWDAALCLGASFVWGTIADAAPMLTETVRPGGSVASRSGNSGRCPRPWKTRGTLTCTAR